MFVELFRTLGWFFLTLAVNFVAQVPLDKRWIIFLNPMASSVEVFEWATLGIGAFSLHPLFPRVARILSCDLIHNVIGHAYRKAVLQKIQIINEFLSGITIWTSQGGIQIILSEGHHHPPPPPRVAECLICTP